MKQHTWRWRTVWRLLTGRWTEPDGNDFAEARRSRVEEEEELRRVLERRPVVEHAAAQIRRAREERDFTSLVEDTFMPTHRHQ